MMKRWGWRAGLSLLIVLGALVTVTLAAPWTGRRITLQRQDAPVAEVVRALARAMGVEGRVPDPAPGVVGVDWRDLPVEEALLDLQGRLHPAWALRLAGGALALEPGALDAGDRERRRPRPALASPGRAGLPGGGAAPSRAEVTVSQGAAPSLRVGCAPPPPNPFPPPAGAIRPPAWNTEQYDPREDQPFQRVEGQPLSTFAADVDTASYSNVRRFLEQGSLPPADAVRIEELLNAFPYADPPPADGRPFAVHTETSACPWAPDHQLLRIGIQGRRIPAGEVPPRNLVFLLDVSGSMASPDKLPLVRWGLRALVEELREQDRVALVVYAGSSGLVLPSTPGSRRQEILDALERLEAGGSTNGGEGIELAYQVAREGFIEGGVNRVILATDGDFNVGTTSQGELVRLIRRQRDQGVFLTVLGVGTGNLKDSQLEQIADHGDGNYAYLDSRWEARRVLVEEAGSTLVTLAKDVKIQVEFNPLRVASYRLIGYENRMLRAEDFADDRKDGGEVGAGHHVTALYELVPPGASGAAAEVPSLRYQESAGVTPAARGGELALVRIRAKRPEGGASVEQRHPVPARAPAFLKASEDLRFAAAVAGFGMLLRETPERGALTWADVLGWARGALGEDPQGARTGFLLLARRAQLLSREAEGGS